jgi:pimeloyl-ACP methyl ester carboxylesterase
VYNCNTSFRYISSCVTWLTTFLEALHVTTPIVLVGTSMGGYIAANFAAAHPDRVKHLVLLAPAGAVDKDLAGTGVAQTPVAAGVHPLLPTSWEQFKDMVRLLAHKPLPMPMWLLKGLWNDAEPRGQAYEAILKSLVESITCMQVRCLMMVLVMTVIIIIITMMMTIFSIFFF